MKSGRTRMAVLLGILGLGDLAMVPFMLAANHHNSSGNPPMAAIIVGAILGLATLASIPALLQGRRWAFWVATICRVVDTVSAVLGVFGGPGTLFVVVGAINALLSIAAIVVLVRLSPRAALERATS
jgi:hypothetical protein